MEEIKTALTILFGTFIAGFGITLGMSLACVVYNLIF